MKLKSLILGLGAALLLSGVALADKSCCEKAKEAGKECTHKCCVEAKKEGKTCGSCNKKDKKEEKKEEKS